MADTNPLREKLADALQWHYEGADAVLAVLAEFIGDGLLDANGQRWTKHRLTGVTVQHEPTLLCDERAFGWGAFDAFVLERSETDQ